MSLRVARLGLGMQGIGEGFRPSCFSSCPCSASISNSTKLLTSCTFVFFLKTLRLVSDLLMVSPLIFLVAFSSKNIDSSDADEVRDSVGEFVVANICLGAKAYARFLSASIARSQREYASYASISGERSQDGSDSGSSTGRNLCSRAFDDCARMSSCSLLCRNREFKFGVGGMGGMEFEPV